MSTTKGGTTGFRKGDLARNLDPVTAFIMTNVGSGLNTGILEQRIRLKGVSQNLTISVGANLVPPSGTDQIELPVLPGTIAAYPAMKHPDSDYVFGRPLKLVAPNIPYQYMFGGGFVSGGDDGIACFGDIVEFRIVVDADQYVSGGIAGSLKLSCHAEYTGSWWNPDTISRLLGDLTFEDCTPIIIETGGE